MIGHLAAFLGGSLVVIGIVVLFLVAMVAVRVPVGSPGFGPSLTAATEDPTYIGPATLLQGVGLTALAFLLGRALPRDPDDRLADVLGLRPASFVWLATAVVGGLLVWIWPSWFAAQLIELTGLDSTVATIGELLVGPLWKTWAMIAAVAIGAPVSEELLFRGYLWRLVELTSGSRGAAFVVTTLLFALYHMDPIHVVALLPTAAFLGWLRWTSGSLWPSILAHFANNAIAVVVVQFMPRETAGALVSFAGGAAFLAVVGLGAWLSRSRSS